MIHNQENLKRLRGKGKLHRNRASQVDEFPVKEEISATRVTRASKIKKQTQQIPIDTPVDEI
jgi:hypothetical protein